MKEKAEIEKESRNRNVILSVDKKCIFSSLDSVVVAKQLAEWSDVASEPFFYTKSP